MRGSESSGIGAERNGSGRNPIVSRDRGTKKQRAVVGERVRAIGGGPAQHGSESDSNMKLRKLASKRERERELLESERLGSCLNGLSRPTLLFRERELELVFQLIKVCVFVWVGVSGNWNLKRRGGI